jgi:N-acetylneuraminic acid mutarotase
MRKSAALLLVLVFLTASCIAMAKPVFSSAELTDVAEDSWASKGPMHLARTGLGVAVVNDKIYAIGGCTISGFMPSIDGSVVLGYRDLEDLGAFVGKNEEYDPAADNWTTRASMPTPRILFATVVYQNKIYCIGGKTSSGLTGVNEVYDPATDTWETKASTPIVAGFATVIDNKIYVVGSKLQIYDPETDKWSVGAPLPSVT